MLNINLVVGSVFHRGLRMTFMFLQIPSPGLMGTNAPDLYLLADVLFHFVLVIIFQLGGGGVAE